MKKKLFILLFIGIMVISLMGCGKEENEIKKEEEKEVSNNSAYLLDYDNENYYGFEDQARLVVIFNIKTKNDILLQDGTFNYKNITGQDFNSSMLLYDYKEEVKANENTKIAVSFKMEKYLYKENDSFDITFSLGKQKGEYSYVINDSASLKKENIKEVSYLEDIIKGSYKDNSEDALMIAVLKKKLSDLEYHGNAYSKLSFYGSTNYNCYDNDTKKRGEKVKDYLSDGAKYDVSITNIIAHLNGDTRLTYDLPSLNYEKLEKYYTGISELLKSYNNYINKYANGLLKLSKKGTQCYRDISPIELKNEGNELRNLLNVKEYTR